MSSDVIHVTMYEAVGDAPDGANAMVKIGCEAYADQTVRVVDAGARSSSDATVVVLHEVGVGIARHLAESRYRDGAHLHLCIEFGRDHHGAADETKEGVTHGEGVRREEARS